MKTKAKLNPATDQRRQTEADKTSRLRALRLAKEAAEKEAAVREAAAKPAKPARRRVYATSLGDPA
jgi:hypothetical protein